VKWGLSRWAVLYSGKYGIYAFLIYCHLHLLDSKAFRCYHDCDVLLFSF